MTRIEPVLADHARSVLVIVDIQEKLFPLMKEAETLGERVRMLALGARELGVPILVTEQYRKGIGPTIQGLLDGVEATVVEKVSFSCMGDDGFRAALQETEREQLIVCGIEAHICVMQTCLQGIAAGYDVFCVEDAVSTRLAHTRDIGLARIRAAGGIPTTTEGVLFELMRRCDVSEFKSLLPLVREGR